jgi:hypothetical protein
VGERISPLQNVLAPAKVDRDRLAAAAGGAGLSEDLFLVLRPKIRAFSVPL